VPLLEGALPFAATLWGIFSVAYSLRFIHGAFFGPPPTSLPRVPHEPPHWMRFPIEFLVVVCIVVGVVPGIAIGPFLDAAARAVLGTSMSAFDLRVWHGFTLPLLMSLVATTGGIALYLALRRSLDGFPEGAPLVRRLKGQRLFERVLVTVSIRWARSLERLLGTRRLQPQLQLLACAAILAALSTGPLQWPEWDSLDLSGVDPVLALLWTVGIACAVSGAVLAKFHRLAALMRIGGAGLVTCLTFVWLSAPDLALTQLLVEIVTTVLILLGLRWLPKRVPDDGLDGRETPAARARRLRDLAIAAVAGAGLAMLAFATMTRPAPDAISGYFLAHAYTGGGGTNVVNVILVDFRGFDTLGEITVLGVVSLTVFALLRRFRPAQDSIAVPEQQRLQSGAHAAADFLTIPAVIMQLLFPVIAVMALFLFLRGHDLPGGGFVAGITMTVAFILQYMAGGIRLVEARLRILPVRWIAMGLLLAAGTGAGSWLFSYPFLTSASAYARLPVIGAVPLASAMLFDLGVFSLVVGATTLILVALARQSIRSHRAPRLDALRET
jgi:multicomponent K+:H+ antiporter subunit A